ncbi:MAG: hypothetical protein HYZ34_01315 [Ignavibacteriae bacterium]|nr:hypothetical protein [Ignavibacteriota bacterium]
MNNSSKNWYDLNKKELHLSKIFSWFSEDFGQDKATLLRFISEFLPNELGDKIKQNPDAWEVKYTDYDWDLNGQ